MDRTIAITGPISRLTRNTPFSRLPFRDCVLPSRHSDLGAAGQEGLVRVLELLESEIITSMGLLGVTCVDQLKPEHLCKVHPIGPTHEMSAFPHMPGGRLI